MIIAHLRRIWAYVALLGVLAVLGLAAPSASADPGNFLIGCNPDPPTRMVDPIVAPGGASAHLHEFSGSIGLNPFSTFASARAAGTTCDLPGDSAGYWTPPIIASSGAVVPSTGFNVYYLGQDQPVIPFPTGLKHVQGNPENTSGATYAMTFGCGTSAGGTTIPATCPPGKGVRSSIYFPFCWDGQSLDNSTHKTLGPCGANFPVRIPQLQMFLDYPPAAVGGRLASDVPGAPAGTSGHSDFWNTWDPFSLAKVVELCVNVPDRACRVDVPTRTVVDVKDDRRVVFSF